MEFNLYARIIEKSIIKDVSIPSVNHLTPKGEDIPIKNIEDINVFIFLVSRKYLQVKKYTEK